MCTRTGVRENKIKGTYMAASIVHIGIAVVDALAETIDKYPEPKELLLFDELSFSIGGCPLNTAAGMAKMGRQSDLIVKLGDDMLGHYIRRYCADIGVGVEHCPTDPDNNTSFSFVCVQSSGERSFLHTVGANATLTPADIDMDFVGSHDICSLTGIMLLPGLDGEPAAKILADAQQRGCLTLLDTVYVRATPQQYRANVDPSLPYLDYFMPSEPEAQQLTGQDDPAEMAVTLQKRGAKNVLIKLGEKGCYYLLADGTTGHTPAYKVDRVVDTTGAGDSWMAGFLTALSDGESIDECCRLGNAVACHCISAIGSVAGIVPLDQIREFQRNTPTV